MTDAEQRRVNWAHSVLTYKLSSEKQRRAAWAVLAKLDPDAIDDYDDDPIRNRGMWE